MKLFGSRTSSPVSESPAGLEGDGSAEVPPMLDADLAEMSFLEHLEELRWSLLKGIGGIIVASIVCLFFSDWIVDVVLLGPAQADFFMYDWLGMDADTLALQNRTLPGQFFVHVGIVVSVGLVVGSPIFVYYLWKFIEPGLYPNEREGLRFSAVFATFFFMLGIAFGYCILTPFAIQFFANYQISPQIRNDFDITKYFSMVTWWSLGCGILFELPVVIYFLAKLGIATPEVLRNGRKYALPVVLVLGAIFTPPDPISQIIVAIPLFLLYEGSIYIAAIAERKRKRELRKALK